MPNSDHKKIDEQDLIASVVSEAVDIPNLELSTFNRFTVEVQKLVEVRAFSEWQTEDKDEHSAVFVHVQFPRIPFGNSGK